MPILAARAELVVLVGEEMAPLAKALGGKIRIEHVASAAEAIHIARQAIRPGDAILVKGSNSIGLAALVDALTSVEVPGGVGAGPVGPGDVR